MISSYIAAANIVILVKSEAYLGIIRVGQFIRSPVTVSSFRNSEMF